MENIRYSDGAGPGLHRDQLDARANRHAYGANELVALDATNATRRASWHTQREERGQDPAMAGGFRDPGTEGLSPNEMCVTALWNQHAQLESFASLAGLIR